MFHLLLASWLHVSLAATLKEATLNAQITSQNGASVTHDPTAVTISDTTYMMQVPYQHSPYDLKLSLNNSWSFKPSLPSTITLTIDGYTPFPHLDADFLIVFAVGDLQYFSFFTHLDATHNIKSRIYPSLSIQQNMTIPVSEWIDNEQIHTRWDRISNNGEWITMHDWNQQALWPLKFVIINDPITNTAIFRFYHNISLSYCTQYIFDTAFVSNEDIDIYIMGDSIDERYEIYQLNIKFTQQSPIIQPTVNPTISPSKNPSFKPPINPSISSSIFPTTENPTFLPTRNPSYEPTPKPSISPSISPSITPSISPSIIGTKHNLSTNLTSTTPFYVNYAVIIVVVFDYKFTDNDTNIIIDILKQIMSKKQCEDSDKLDVSITAKTDIATSTIINCTVILCDIATETKFNDSLQKELVQNINQQTDLDININKTDIKIHDIKIDETISTTTMYINNNILNEMDDSESIEAQILLWMVKLIALQLILCCLMTICIFGIKLRTKHLKVKHGQINKKFNKVIQEIYGAMIDDHDGDEESLTNEEHINLQIVQHINAENVAFKQRKHRKLSIIQNGSDSKPNKIKRKGTFFALHSNTTTPNHKIASSSLFDRSPGVQYEEISETRSHDGLTDILRDKYGVNKIRRDIKGHIIMSDHSRYPSIPTTIREKVSDEIADEIPEEIPEEITMSPTLTFTYPEHLNKLRRHGLV